MEKFAKTLAFSLIVSAFIMTMLVVFGVLKI